MKITRRQLRRIIKEAMGRYQPRKKRSYNQASPAAKSMANSAKRKFLKNYPDAKVKINAREGWVEVNGKKAVNISSASGRPMSAEDMINQMHQAYAKTAPPQLEEIRLRKDGMLNEQNVSQGLIEQFVAAMDAIYEDVQMQLEYDEGAYEEGWDAERRTAQIIMGEVGGFLESLGESLQGSL